MKSEIEETSWAVGGCTWIEDGVASERVRASVGDSTIFMDASEARQMATLLLLTADRVERYSAEPRAAVEGEKPTLQEQQQ